MTPLGRRVMRLETAMVAAAPIRVLHRPAFLQGEALRQWEQVALPPRRALGLTVVIRQFAEPAVVDDHGTG